MSSSERSTRVIDARRFRDVLGNYPTGVVVVTFGSLGLFLHSVTA